MVVIRLLATLLVGFFAAWLVVALQHLAASGSLSRVATVGVLAAVAVFALLGFRLLV